jgi:hypothetical protein
MQVGIDLSGSFLICSIFYSTKCSHYCFLNLCVFLTVGWQLPIYPCSGGFHILSCAMAPMLVWHLPFAMPTVSFMKIVELGSANLEIKKEPKNPIPAIMSNQSMYGAHFLGHQNSCRTLYIVASILLGWLMIRDCASNCFLFSSTNIKLKHFSIVLSVACALWSY